MGFLAELQAWTERQVQRNVLASEIRKLLLGGDIGILYPILRRYLPKELMEYRLPDREEDRPPLSGDWLCWPSADEAVYGWGEPYENPPGVPVNPPLGTIQTSYDDNSRIAREFNQITNVIHGVNKIAQPFLWRDPNSRLVVSWDSDDIYSNGTSIYSGINILAACVRYTGPTPYLIWLTRSPDRMATQECTIVDNAITGLTGPISYCNISGGLGSPDYADFSQDGNALIINAGGTISGMNSFSVVVPEPFAGQTVPLNLEQNADPDTSIWTSILDFESQRRFLVRSVYLDNVLTHIWLTVHLRSWRSDITTVDEPFGATNEIYYCDTHRYLSFSSPPIPYVRSTNQKQDYFVNVKIEVGSNEIYNKNLTVYNTESWQWTTGRLAYQGNFPPTPGTPQIPDPTVGPFPGWTCGEGTIGAGVPLIVLEDTIDDIHTSADSISAEFGRISFLELASSTDGGSNWTKQLKTTIHRNGTDSDSATTPGDYGSHIWAARDSITSLSQLQSAVVSVANKFVSVFGIIGNFIGPSQFHITSLDLSADYAVQCAWAQRESDSEYQYVNLLENENIEEILSIDGQTNPRIVIKDSVRYIGLLKTPEQPSP